MPHQQSSGGLIAPPTTPAATAVGGKRKAKDRSQNASPKGAAKRDGKLPHVAVKVQQPVGAPLSDAKFVVELPDIQQLPAGVDATTDVDLV